MKYIKFLMALLAVCVLVIPAFSMSDSGNRMKDCKDQICPQCHKPIMSDRMGTDGQNGPASMMGNENKACGCQDDKKSDGCKQKVCSQCNKPMMGSGAQDEQICHCLNPNPNPCQGNWNCLQGHDGMGR